MAITTTNALGYVDRAVADADISDVDVLVSVPFTNDTSGATEVLYENDLLRLNNTDGQISLVLRYKLASGFDSTWNVTKNGSNFLSEWLKHGGTYAISDSFTGYAEYDAKLDDSVLYNQDGPGVNFMTMSADELSHEFTLVEGNAGADGPASAAEQALGMQLHGWITISGFAPGAVVTIRLRGRRLRADNFP
jgi:hypothetical protein